MKIERIMIKNIPVLLFGEDSDKIYIYIHGKNGNKEEAQSLAQIACPKGYRVLSFDLPEHGERADSKEKLLPWTVLHELHEVAVFAKQNSRSASLCAVSIGAYFSLLAFENEVFDKCLFVSPILDMTALINKMMMWASVTPEDLQEKKEIPTNFGETLSIEYYNYAKTHPILKWQSQSAVLYAGHDNMTERDTVTSFCKKFGCHLRIFEDGEHWFHTEAQLAVLNDFIEKEVSE